MSLQDQVCIITGGGSGIGRDAALVMAKDGAKVALVGRTGAKVEAVRGEIDRGLATARRCTSFRSPSTSSRRSAGASKRKRARARRGAISGLLDVGPAR